MTKKQIVACILFVCIVTGALYAAFRAIKSPKEPKKDATSTAAVTTAVTTKSGTEKPEDSAKDSASEKVKESAKSIKGDNTYTEENEVSNFAIPDELKDEFANSGKFRFDAQVGQFGATVARFPNRLHNWESYPYGPRNMFEEGATDSTWISIIKLRQQATGMTDAAAFPIKSDDPDQAYEEALFKAYGDIALAVGYADFMVNWLFEDGTRFGDVVTDLQKFIDEDQAARDRAKELKELKAEEAQLRYKPDDNKQKAAVQEKIAKLEEQGCGVSRWLDVVEGDPYNAKMNADFIGYFAVMANVMDTFHVIGIQNVSSSVNYYLPICGDVDQIHLVKNNEYEEINQPAIVMGMLNKNGKVSMKWAIDKRDARPLKVLEWSKNPSNPKNQKRTETRQATTTTTTTTQQPPQQRREEKPVVEQRIVQQPAQVRTTTTTTVVNNSSSSSSSSSSSISTPTPTPTPTPAPQPTPTPTPHDGEGAKVQSESSAFQGNAPQNSGTHLASDGDGTKTAEPVQPNSSPSVADTVVEGSADSGRRSISEQTAVNSGGTETTAPSQGPATNGSTESSDTSNRESTGSTDSSGATVDNSIASSSGENGQSSANDTVSEAPAESATPSSEAQAGFTLSDDMGD